MITSYYFFGKELFFLGPDECAEVCPMGYTLSQRVNSGLTTVCVAHNDAADFCFLCSDTGDAAYGERCGSTFLLHMCAVVDVIFRYFAKKKYI